MPPACAQQLGTCWTNACKCVPACWTADVRHTQNSWIGSTELSLLVQGFNSLAFIARRRATGFQQSCLHLAQGQHKHKSKREIAWNYSCESIWSVTSCIWMHLVFAAQEPAGEGKTTLGTSELRQAPGSQGDYGMLHCGIVLLTVRASAPKSAVYQPWGCDTLQLHAVSWQPHQSCYTE